MRLGSKKEVDRRCQRRLKRWRAGEEGRRMIPREEVRVKRRCRTAEEELRSVEKMRRFR